MTEFVYIYNPLTGKDVKMNKSVYVEQKIKSKIEAFNAEIDTNNSALKKIPVGETFAWRVTEDEQKDKKYNKGVNRHNISKIQKQHIGDFDTMWITNSRPPPNEY